MAESAQARATLREAFPRNYSYTNYSRTDERILDIVAMIGALSTDERERADTQRILLTALHERRR